MAGKAGINSAVAPAVYEALKKIVLTEGFWRPLRGINVTMLGAGPAHAMYFACYEKMKNHLANGIFICCRQPAFRLPP
uniref:Mitoferrin-1 n=1 Tax=Buteo japonicus TaxID=224669 RepID=A0A8C0ASZ8_9AVES